MEICVSPVGQEELRAAGHYGMGLHFVPGTSCKALAILTMEQSLPQTISLCLLNLRKSEGQRAPRARVPGRHPPAQELRLVSEKPDFPALFPGLHLRPRANRLEGRAVTQVVSKWRETC